NIGDRPLKPIWNFYNRGKLLDNSGHYEAFCKACNQIFSPGKASKMEKHIISECTKVSETTKEAVIYIIKSREKSIGTKHSSDQLNLDEYLENTVIPDK
ncbi:21406_t:CDS:1, partial [Gigaspora rosea]